MTDRKSMISDFGSRPNIRAVLLAILAAISTSQIGCKSRVSPSPSPTPKPVETLKQPDSFPVSPLLCPTFGSYGVPTIPPAKGGHKVTLSWKASAPADSKHAAAIGYCIYRGAKHSDKSPELVNSVPFQGTNCADDLVQNGKRYYYVIRAISADRLTSIISNEVPALIPTSKPKSRPSSRASVPLCREPIDLK